MRVLVVLAGLLAGCLAQVPHPCKGPPLLSGQLTVSTQNEKLWAFAKMLYDAMGLRVRFLEMGTYDNKSYTYDILMLFREGAMYEIHTHNRTCVKSALKADFPFLEIPKDASLVGQAVLGTSSAPFEGLLVNTWTGQLPDKGGEYISTVTEFGCIPVTTLFQTKEFGWTVINFFNNIIGIQQPDLLNPPDFCPKTDMKMVEVQPRHFLSVFHKKH